MLMTLTIDRIGFVFYVNPAVRPSRTCTTFSFVIYARNSIYGVIYSTLQTNYTSEHSKYHKLSQMLNTKKWFHLTSQKKIHTEIYTKHLFSHHFKKIKLYVQKNSSGQFTYTFNIIFMIEALYMYRYSSNSWRGSQSLCLGRWSRTRYRLAAIM